MIDLKLNVGFNDALNPLTRQNKKTTIILGHR